MPEVTDRQREACREVLVEYQDYTKPAPQKWLAARIMTLLEHYFVPNRNENAERAVAQDWFYSLRNLPLFAVQQACEEWRDFETRKPVPADIRERAEKIAAPMQRDCQRLLAIVNHVPEKEERGTRWGDLTPEQREEHEAMMAELAENHKPDCLGG